MKIISTRSALLLCASAGAMMAFPLTASAQQATPPDDQ
jgi:hypothetical protein